MDTASYAALRSPRADSKKLDEEPDRYARLAADTASAVARFHQSTRAIMQKMLVLGTAQDSAASRDALHALTDEGNALVGHVQRSLQELDALCDAPGVAASPRRRRRAQVDALASDFRSQCWNFEDTCRRLIDAERAAIAHIRQHVERREFSGDAAADAGAGASSAAVALDLANFDEEKRRHTDSYDDDASQNGAWRSRSWWDRLMCSPSPHLSACVLGLFGRRPARPTGSRALPAQDQPRAPRTGTDSRTE